MWLSKIKNFLSINEKAEDWCTVQLQLAITCSKLTIETLEHGVKYFQSDQ